MTKIKCKVEYLGQTNGYAIMDIPSNWDLEALTNDQMHELCKELDAGQVAIVNILPIPLATKGSE